MNATHWHAMSKTAFNAFMQNKGKTDLIAPWTVSDNDGYMYFYSLQKNLSNWDDAEQAADECKRSAYWNAQLQAAISGDSEIIILGFNLEHSGVDYSDDLSCENMQDSADCARCSDITPAMVIEAYKAECNPWLAPFTLAGALDNPYFNIGAIPPLLFKAAQAISEATVYLDQDESPEFQPFEVKHVL